MPENTSMNRPVRSRSKRWLAIGLAMLTIGALVGGGLAISTGAAAQLAAAVSQAGASRVVWRPGIAPTVLQQAKIVRVGPGFRTSDLALLRDDQWLESANGQRVRVAQVKIFRQAFADAKARPTPADSLRLVRLPSAPCSPLRPGETRQEILARPPGDVICMPGGRSISVEQLRLAVPYMRRHNGLDLSEAGPAPPPTGPAIHITSSKQLADQLAHAPDTTVLESASGARATVGQIKAVLRAKAADALGGEGHVR